MLGGMDVAVRVARDPADWRAVRELCCLTGAAGDPIAPERWPVFAEIWIGPYQRLRPEWTYVADGGGRVLGYLTGCPDTGPFERERRWRSTLPLAAAALRGRYPATEDTRRLVRRALRLAPATEAPFSARVRARLTRDYPAHLHMNVAAGARGRGVGRALLAAFAGDLRARDVPGVHLFCGPGPRAFYAGAGFQELALVLLPSGIRVHALGRRIA
jgi:GNAT superfamily N-acetyltransferase